MFMCMSVCYVCTTYMYYLGKSEKGIQVPGAIVSGSCELPCQGWELNKYS